jgi:hypothetical protein
LCALSHRKSIVGKLTHSADDALLEKIPLLVVEKSLADFCIEIDYLHKNGKSWRAKEEKKAEFSGK